MFRVEVRSLPVAHMFRNEEFSKFTEWRYRIKSNVGTTSAEKKLPGSL